MTAIETTVTAPAPSPRFTPLTEGWTVAPVTGPLPPGFPTSEIPARVPGVIHTDLVAAGLIADPFDADNESEQQWIGDTAWRYRTTFQWHLDRDRRHDLVARGLDTVATIELNDMVVAQTENQHRSYRFDISEMLVEGENELTITFAAPVPEALSRAQKHGAKPRVNHHEYNQLRKTACQFGWDWGIDVAGCGIWREIGLESWSEVRIDSVRPLVDIESENGTEIGVLTAHVALDWDNREPVGPVEVVVRVAGASERVFAEPGADGVTVVVKVTGIERWWPIGHGAQPLYDVVVAAGEANWRGRVGFRTVTVDTKPDEDGIPFSIRINDRPVLIRGINWIPDHAFLTEIDAERYGRRLRDALDANVNLIRVWGGGIYESDDFYAFADQHGLLVWQDFLFACAAYAEEDYLATEIEAEARYQITRLSQHPSLIIWNGNNECAWGWADWGWRPRVGDGTWGKGYYERLLPELLAELDSTRFYSPASPYSFGDFLHPNDERNGTMHIWDVWNQKDYTAYRDYHPRFVSEFGFQGPPAWSTLAAVVHDEPLDPYGDQMLVHQKAHLGNRKLQRGQEGHLPESRTISQWHWATQLNQAHAIRFGIEHFRSLTPHNTGVVLWQLNDNWPVVSWAAVDFAEHRKPLWHALRSAYAPRLATIQPRSSAVAVRNAFEGVPPVKDALAYVLVNDTDEAIESTALELKRVTFAGEVLAAAVLGCDVPARGVVQIELPSELTTFDDPTREILVAGVHDDIVARAVWNPAEIVEQQLDPAALTAATCIATGNDYEVRVEASSYCRDVFLQVDRVDPVARVDRGLVTLLPGETASFIITAPSGIDPHAFVNADVLRSANQLLEVITT